MDAIELLDCCRAATRELRSLQEREKRLREVAYYPGSRMDSSGGSRSTAERDRMAAHFAALDKLERAVMTRKSRKQWEEWAAAALIDRELAAHGQSAEVIYGYYVRRQPVKAIAMEMHLSISRVKNLKTDGIAQLRLVPSVDDLLPPEYFAREDDDE